MGNRNLADCTYGAPSISDYVKLQCLCKAPTMRGAEHADPWITTVQLSLKLSWNQRHQVHVVR